MQFILLALTFFAGLLKPMPAAAQVAAEEPLSLQNLGGKWGVVFVYVKREGFSNSIARSMPGYYLAFESVKRNRLTLKKFDETTNGLMKQAPLNTRAKGKSFEIRLTSNAAPAREGIPFYYLGPMYSENGVDLLRQSDTDSAHLIRFRSTPETVKAGFGGMTFKEFCGGPAAIISKPAKREIEIATRLVDEFPNVFSNYRLSNAARFGLFLSPEFKEAFGAPFADLGEPAQRQLLERLKYCAVMYPDREIADPIADAVLTSSKYNNIRGFLRLGNTSGRLPSLRLALSEGHVEGLSLRHMLANEKFAPLAAGLAAASQDRSELETKLESIKEIVDSLQPSRIEAVVSGAGRKLATLKQDEARRRAEDLERNGPPLSRQELIRNASEEYFLRNCNRIFLAMRAGKSGSGAAFPGILLSSPVARGRSCVVRMPTHILKFGVRSVGLEQCSGAARQTCKFTLDWSCEFDANPAFGSTARQFDPVCPAIRAAPVVMRGEFAVQSHRTWRALKLDW